MMNTKISRKQETGFSETRFFLFMPYLFLFLFSFVYFGFIAGYTCFFQEKTSLFLFSRDFLFDNLHQPGALLVYAGKFLTTFYFYPAAGGFIISLTIFAASYLAGKIFELISGSRSVFIPLLTGIALFYLQTNYRYPEYNSLGIVLQLCAFYTAARFSKGWLPVILFPAWYFITGAFAWISGLMFVSFLFIRSLKNDWLKIALLLIIGFATIYISKQFIFFETSRKLLVFPISVGETGSDFKIFIALCGLVVLLPFIARIRIRKYRNDKIRFLLRNVAPLLLVAVILITVSIIRYDKKTKEYFMVEKLFYENRFNDITEYLTKNPSSNILTIFLGNIALCETGRLNDMLFHFRQSPDGRTLFLKWEMHSEPLRRGGYFYYTIGMINEAHRWAYENMVMDGLTPEGLKMLIKTEMINGNYKVASKYITILRKTLFYRNLALKYEKMLFNDQAVNSDPELGIKRRDKVSHDFFAITNDPYANIEKILSADSLNRNAFEYKMAYHLLKKDYQGVVAEFPRLSQFGFTRIPVHLEEAALVYKRIASGMLPPGSKIEINRDTEKRFNEFMQTLKNYGNNPAVAEPFLRKNFGSSFWYYLFYD